MKVGKITKDADDPFATAWELALPGDRIVYRDGTNLTTLVLKHAEPNAMAEAGYMTWTKNFLIEAVEPVTEESYEHVLMKHLTAGAHVTLHPGVSPDGERLMEVTKENSKAFVIGFFGTEPG